MALESVGFELHVTVVDKGANTSNLVFKMDSADYATLATDATTVMNRLDAVTDAVIKSYSLVTRFVENALALPTVGEVENRGTVIAQIAANPLKRATIHIPAPVDGIFVGAAGSGSLYNKVDGTDAALLAYLSTWQNPTPIANISDGEYIDATNPFVDGKRTHRQSSFG